MEQTATTTENEWAGAAEASAEAEADRVESRDFEQRLAVKLEDHVLIDLGAELARALEVIESLREQKKASAKGYDQQIENVDDQVHSIGAKLRSGSDEQLVQCRETRFYRTGNIKIVRLDTGEIVSERAMGPHERQPPLPGLEGGETAPDDEAGDDEELGATNCDACGGDLDESAQASDDGVFCSDCFAKRDAPPAGETITDPEAVLEGAPPEAEKPKRGPRKGNGS